ncbi:MAG TPA: cytochrome C biogenesis protein ResC [Nitrospirae bacterium]|nr:cytochrome C biogenesis protein ResC [Nitrospirota bacterium]
MKDPVTIDVAIHWVVVLIYITATLFNTIGVIFKREVFEKRSYVTLMAGMFVHGVVIIYRWVVSGHGPYMVKHEVLSSYAWVLLFLFLIFTKYFPRIKISSVVVFPSAFLMVALGQFTNPAIKKIPPSLRSIWLVLHVLFYKIAMGTLVIAFAFSLFYILKKRSSARWTERLPELGVSDVYAYRFTGFGFIFWAIAMLAGSIWAYQSWGRFWGWDPVETWSLLTWVFFGIYLHLRRFFAWKGERAAYLYTIGFILAIVSIFFTPLIEASIHSAYFR